MAFLISTTHQFEKDLQRCIRRGYPMQEFRKVIQILERDGCLPTVYRPHKLKGDRKGEWECHIQPDWLLVWKRFDNELRLLMLNTGTHSDLFDRKRK